MGSPEEEHEAGVWRLASGLWQPEPPGSGFSLRGTRLGQRPTDVVSKADLESMLSVSRSTDDPPAAYPPEFRFSPVTGKPLLRSEAVAAAAQWIPPYGATSLKSSKATPPHRGLRMTALRLNLAPAAQSPEQDPQWRIPQPPPGEYEFISATFGTQRFVLIALDPEKGVLYAWMEHAAHWVALADAHGGWLVETQLPRLFWGCEMASASGEVVYLPTQQGLAVLEIDAASLQFTTRYEGGGAAVAAPMEWAGDVWLPVCRDGAALEVVRVSGSGGVTETFAVPAAPAAAVFSPPVCDSRAIVWAGADGQIVVRKTQTGAIAVAFLEWPRHIKPVFDFGCPFLSRDGLFWQLCWDSGGAGSYTYLTLGRSAPERAATLSPRLCTGTLHFRFGARLKTEPWLEPEQGDDSSADTVVLPLVESTLGRTAVGLEIETTGALEGVVKSSERTRAVALIASDDHADLRFHTLWVSEPGRARVFVHDRKLWIYHPLHGSIDGWSLAS